MHVFDVHVFCFIGRKAVKSSDELVTLENSENHLISLESLPDLSESVHVQVSFYSGEQSVTAGTNDSYKT